MWTRSECRRDKCRPRTEAHRIEEMRYVPHLGIHWVAEIVEEISKPPKYTPEAVLSVLDEFELGLRRWYDGVHLQCVVTPPDRQYVEYVSALRIRLRMRYVCCR